MATEKGMVVKTDGRYASVKTSRSAGCERCVSYDFCGNRNSVLEVEVEAVNDAGAGVGDIVVIKCSTTTLVKVLFFVFVVPILALVCGVVLGQALSNSISSDSTPWSIGFGFISLTGSMFVVRWFDHRIAGKDINKTKIIQVLSKRHLVE